MTLEYTARESPNQRNQLRPTKIAEFIGQNSVVELITLTKNSIKDSDSLFPHTLLSGPPGLGKTTLAEIISSDSNLIRIVGGLVDLNTFIEMYLRCSDKDVVFIDEIHAAKKTVLELFYLWMEDGYITDRSGAALWPRRITLIAATTDMSKLPKPLVDRFEIHAELDLYPTDELVSILSRAQSVLKTKLSDVELFEIANRARGTPRIAVKYLRRVRDIGDLNKTWNLLGVHANGLLPLDLRVLHVMVNVFKGRPVGSRILAANLSEDEKRINNFVEPHLLKLGLIEITPRGRKITTAGLKVLIDNG